MENYSAPKSNSTFSCIQVSRGKLSSASLSSKNTDKEHKTKYYVENYFSWRKKTHFYFLCKIYLHWKPSNRYSVQRRGTYLISKYHHQVRLISAENGGSQRKYLLSLVLKRHIVWIPKWIKMQ